MISSSKMLTSPYPKVTLGGGGSVNPSDYFNIPISGYSTTRNSAGSPDYILLHPIRVSGLFGNHYTIGTIKGSAGSSSVTNRKISCDVDTGSAFDNNLLPFKSKASITNFVTLVYNAVTYCAIEIPSGVSVGSFTFTGYYNSPTGDSLKLVYGTEVSSVTQYEETNTYFLNHNIKNNGTTMSKYGFTLDDSFNERLYKSGTLFYLEASGSSDGLYLKSSKDIYMEAIAGKLDINVATQFDLSSNINSFFSLSTSTLQSNGENRILSGLGVKFAINIYGTSSGNVFVWEKLTNSTPTELMRLNESGNLGINTNNPLQGLHLLNKNLLVENSGTGLITVNGGTTSAISFGSGANNYLAVASGSNTTTLSSNNFMTLLTNSGEIKLQSQAGVRVVTNTLILSASTTSYPSMYCPDGVAPSSLLDGYIWFVGNSMFRRIGGVTKSVTFA